MPGTSGDVYLYRGYALRQATAPAGYDPVASPVPSTLVWQSITAGLLQPGVDCIHLQGLESAKPCKIERATGKYGGSQIDEIITEHVGGLQIVIRSGDFTG